MAKKKMFDELKSKPEVKADVKPEPIREPEPIEEPERDDDANEGPNEEPEEEVKPISAPKPPPSKIDIVREALEHGFSKNDGIADYAIDTYGVEISAAMIASYKSTIKRKQNGGSSNYGSHGGTHASASVEDVIASMVEIREWAESNIEDGFAGLAKAFEAVERVTDEFGTYAFCKTVVEALQKLR